MKCEICGKGMEQGVTLFRVNELGVTGVWRCREHMEKQPDPIVEDIVNIIEFGGTKKERDRS